MRRISGLFARLLALGVVSLFLGVAGVAAQDRDARVIVPDVPGGALVAGCYRAVVTIYGGYNFRFCLEQRGTYRVTGRGVRCDGRLDWNTSGAEVRVRLRRTSCGGGVAWSADRMTCRPSLIAGIIGMIIDPDRPFLNALRCDYRPAAGSGEDPIWFIARRQ